MGPNENLLQDQISALNFDDKENKGSVSIMRTSKALNAMIVCAAFVFVTAIVFGMI